MPRSIARRILTLTVLLGVAGSASVRAGDLITFETTPDGSTPIDNARLIDPYAISGGGTVRFFFDTNDNNVFDAGVDRLPRFEEVGTDGNDGFVARSVGDGVHDRARRGYGDELGHFFLRQPDGIGTLPGPFIIAYDTTQTIREFSGEIWDIDAGEQWRVDVLNASNDVLATLRSPKGVGVNNPDSLDSLPWLFGFKDLADGVVAIRLTFIGDKSDGIGLAFNNFSPTFAVAGSVVPEPSSVVLLAIGLAAAAGFARRRGGGPLAG
ncbi:PEP-CTERM sorting domain-containing protein [Aquisphaera insulae]|uniref:PEP-CTERM sorting domain-containing protein n=1 Tax=Aquisphaera insulae TaxID=2712864 RepID=UPI0013EA96A2|nr:PEP-CTERM sorting domain-containing protein [Aquisphaera insulae]